MKKLRFLKFKKKAVGVYDVILGSDGSHERTACSSYMQIIM